MDEQQNKAISPQEIIEEEIREQQTISFQDDVLVLVLTNFMAFYVTLVSICKALDLNSKGQAQRIKQSSELSSGLRQFTISTRGGPQRVYCLNGDWIGAWLDTVRIGKLSPAQLTKFESYRRDLLATIYDVFHRVGSLKGQPWLEEYFTKTPAPFSDAPVEQQEDPLLERKLAILASIPPPHPGDHFLATDSQVDRSLREVSFAREELWDFETETPTFPSSNHLQIFLGTPENPLDANEAPAKLAALGGSTVLTARIAMGLWNLRRHDNRLSINGSSAIHIDEIFAWRGLHKHKRSAYTGSSRSRTDGYRTEQKQQILRDLSLLASCWVRGHCTVLIGGREKTFFINGSYLRYSTVTTINSFGDDELVGFFLAPGDWISTYEEHDRNFLVEIDRRIFLLNPQNEQHELRLALYLVELWRQQEQEEEPITMDALLQASMIVPDKTNKERFIIRIEHALQVLWERGILGAEPRCLNEIDRSKNRWANDWFSSQWLLVPPENLRSQQGKTITTKSQSATHNDKKNGG